MMPDFATAANGVDEATTVRIGQGAMLEFHIDIPNTQKNVISNPLSHSQEGVSIDVRNPAHESSP